MISFGGPLFNFVLGGLIFLLTFTPLINNPYFSQTGKGGLSAIKGGGFDRNRFVCQYCLGVSQLAPNSYPLMEAASLR